MVRVQRPASTTVPDGSSRPHRSAATNGAWVSACACLMLVTAAAWVAAHEGHGTAAVKPVYRDLQAGDATYRLGFAMQPQDALVGEDIRLEFHILPVAVGGTTPPVPGAMDVQIISDGTAPIAPHVSPGDKPNTFLVRHRFDASGQYRVASRVKTGSDTVSAEFPILVSAGPLRSTAMIIDAIVVLIVGALLFGRLRPSPTTSAPPASRSGSMLLAGVGVVALIVGHLWVSPTVGRMFLPERHTGAVPWATPAPVPAASATDDHEHAPGTPPHTHDAQPAKAPEQPRGHGKESTPPPGQ